MLQGDPPRVARLSAIVCWPVKGVNIFLATPLGNENQAIMADLSNPSNPASSEELLEEYRREYDKAVEGLLLSCFRITEHGVVKIKEL